MAGWSFGCAHPISEPLRDRVDPDLTGERLIRAPENYIGQKVVLGGMIVETRNFEGYSEIEVVQIDLDWTGYLKNRENTHGRVIFRHPGYVESMIFKKGREVTVGGSVRGTQPGQVGEAGYTFLVVDVEEIQLWETYDVNYYDYSYYRYGAWGPFYSAPYGHRYGPGVYYW